MEQLHPLGSRRSWPPEGWSGEIGTTDPILDEVAPRSPEESDLIRAIRDEGWEAYIETCESHDLDRKLQTPPIWTAPPKRNL